MLNPDLALLDEIDSGLDVDSVTDVKNQIKEYLEKGKTLFIITHHANIIEGLVPDNVHILKNGQIVYTGDGSVIEKVQKEGFSWL